MADGTHISWTDATWNPITGCSIKSLGCANCYAMTLAAGRLRHHPSRAGLTRKINGLPVWTGDVRFNEGWLDQPRRWNAPRDIFVVAHGDLFYERVPKPWQSRVMTVIQECPWHRFQILTKRPDVASRFLRDWAPMPHVLVGASVERQQEADERRSHLAEIAGLGWRTWVSYEPALGLVDWTGWEFIKWMVSGGESSRRARPSHPDWHRATRDWSVAHGIPFHFKQWGTWIDWQQAGGHHWSNVTPQQPGYDGPCLGTLNGGTDKVPLFGGRALPTIHTDGPQATIFVAPGKRDAGAMLDGREWREMPHESPPP